MTVRSSQSDPWPTKIYNIRTDKDRSSDNDDKAYWTEYYNKMDILKKVRITLQYIIFILGIIENGLVIWIAGFRMKKTINSVWLLNLAIADFLGCVFFSLNHFFLPNLGDWSSVFIYSILMELSFYLAISASVLLLMAMSIDRWVSVMWPFWAKVHRTPRLVRITAGVIWMLCLVLICLGVCFVVAYANDLITIIKIMQIVKLIRLVILFVIPFLIIVTSYVTIFLKLRKSKRSQRSQRPYRIITAVILCFFICWFPYYIEPFISWHDFRNVFYHITIIIIQSLAYLNSCINPIIYVYMDPDFRDGFLRSIPFFLQRAISKRPDDPGENLEDPQPVPTTNV